MFTLLFSIRQFLRKRRDAAGRRRTYYDGSELPAPFHPAATPSANTPHQRRRRPHRSESITAATGTQQARASRDRDGVARLLENYSTRRFRSDYLRAVTGPSRLPSPKSLGTLAYPNREPTPWH